MGVEPEHVLEQHRIAAERRVEDADAVEVLEDQQQQRDAEHRCREHLEDGGGVDRPDEQRQLEPGEARRAQLVHRDDEVQAREDRAEPEDEDRHADDVGGLSSPETAAADLARPGGVCGDRWCSGTADRPPA